MIIFFSNFQSISDQYALFWLICVLVVMPRAYRPSPNELERLLREEKEKRKRMRLLQVREMSRMHALRIRNSYKSELNRQVNKVVADCRVSSSGYLWKSSFRHLWHSFLSKKLFQVELLEDKENKMRSLKEDYNKSLKQRGEGHDLAKEWVSFRIKFVLSSRKAVFSDVYTFCTRKCTRFATWDGWRRL